MGPSCGPTPSPLAAALRPCAQRPAQGLARVPGEGHVHLGGAGLGPEKVLSGEGPASAKVGGAENRLTVKELRGWAGGLHLDLKEGG